MMVEAQRHQFMGPGGTYPSRFALRPTSGEINSQEAQDMASETLKNLRVAILATDGVEQVELTEPRKALDAAGAKTKLVSPKDGQIRSWNFSEWSDKLPVDLA